MSGTQQDTSDALNADQALTLAQTILQLTSDLETALRMPEPPVSLLGQLILRRGKLLDDLGRIHLGRLPVDCRDQIRQHILDSQSRELTIASRLSEHRAAFGAQMKDLKESRTLLDTYRLGGTDTPGTRSENV